MAQLIEALATRSRVWFPMVSLEFFIDINPSGRTMALGSIYPLTEIFHAGKGGRCVGLQPYHFHVPSVWKFGTAILLEPKGPVQAFTGIALPVTNKIKFILQYVKRTQYVVLTSAFLAFEILYRFTLHAWMQFNLCPLEKHAFLRSELYKMHSSVALPGGLLHKIHSSMALPGHLLYKISLKSCSKYGNNA